MSDLKKFEQVFRKMNIFDQTMGLDFEIEAPGQIIYQLEVQRKHLSSPQIAHGGVIAAMMDASLGLTALSFSVVDEMLVSTVEFKLNFLRPAREGDILTGRGHIDYRGKSLIVCNSNISNQEGHDIAKGIGTFNLYPMDKKDFSMFNA